mgnify:CR=1 FL=1
MKTEDGRTEDGKTEGALGDGRLSPKILGMAFTIGLPLYVVIAWVLQSSGAGNPSLLGADRRIMAYALLCFLGLGSAVGSFLVRNVLMARPFAALIVGLALAEMPAILGLVYFVFSYDWAGFLLLVAASVVCFILHTRWA